MLNEMTINECLRGKEKSVPKGKSKSQFSQYFMLTDTHVPKLVSTPDYFFN